MKTLVRSLVAALLLTTSLAGPAMSKDDLPGGPGSGGGGCMYCDRTYLPITGGQVAACRSSGGRLGVGYRTCELEQHFGGNLDCVLSNWGNCSVQSGGGGGGYIG